MLAALITFALAAGGLSAVQIGLNVELAGSARGPLAAALINFAVGLAALLGVAALVVGLGTALDGAADAPWWSWAGGLLGASYVVSTVLLFPRLGAAITVGLFITGQMLASLVIDELGLLGVPPQSLSPGRAAGGALAIIGVGMMSRARAEREATGGAAGSPALGWIALALAVGAVLPTQGAINAMLAEALTTPFAAAAANFVVGAAALATALAVAVASSSASLPRPAELRDAPPWAWLGGICGAVYVLSAIVLIPEIGAAATVAFTVAGQQLISLLIDHYGWLRLPRRPVPRIRLVGGALLLTGVALIQIAS